MISASFACSFKPKHYLCEIFLWSDFGVGNKFAFNIAFDTDIELTWYNCFY